MSYDPAQIKEAGLDDFRVYLAQVWDHLDLPDPTPLQYRIAHWLQHGPRRLVLQAFRGAGKSWITVAFCTWKLLLDPETKVEMVSASQSLADDNAQFAHSLIREMPLLSHLRPGKNDRKSALAFDVGPAKASKDPSLKSAGITGQITGTRADIIVADDVEIPENSYTSHRREKLAERVKEFDAILKPGGRVVYLGTPQVEQSLYRRLENRGYDTRVWTAEVPEDPEKYGEKLAPFVREKIEAGATPGSPVDPTRFDARDLAERKASYGQTGYALQFMLDTTPSALDKHPLKCRDLIVHDVDDEIAHVKLVWSSDERIDGLSCGGFDGDYYVRPAAKSDEMAPYTGTVMAIDPAGSGDDELGYAIIRYCQGLLYLVDVGGFEDGYDEDTLTGLAAKMARYDVDKYVIEENFGGGMFSQLLDPHVRRMADAKLDTDYDAWSTGKKEWRILDTLEPVIQSHRLVVDRSVIEEDLEQQRDQAKYSLIHQMTRMARQKDALPHEDRLEAVSMAASYWTDKMDRDLDENVERHKQEQLEKELEEWHRSVHVPGADSLSFNKNWNGNRRR